MNPDIELILDEISNLEKHFSEHVERWEKRFGEYYDKWECKFAGVEISHDTRALSQGVWIVAAIPVPGTSLPDHGSRMARIG